MTSSEDVVVEDDAGASRPSPRTSCPTVNPHTQLRCGQPAVDSTGFCTHHGPGRVPCPVDPRHFVSSKNLKKHVAKCNATKRAAELSSRPFYREGTNRGRGGRPTSLELEARKAAEEAERDGSRAFARPRLAPARKAAAERLGREKLLELLRRVREAADGLLAPVEPPLAPAAAAAARSPEPRGESGPRPVSEKHDTQNDAIVGIALSAGVFGFRRRRRDDDADQTVAVVELGAGRGYLGAAAADALVSLDSKERSDDENDDVDDDGKAPPRPLRCSALVLVDRRAYRNKAERHYRGEKPAGKREPGEATTSDARRAKPPPLFALNRATVDLADVLLPSLPGVSARDSVAVLGKHLCGPATDFSLRAAASQLRISDDEREKRNPLSGVAIATCCHHCCTWSDFCGKREFLSAGFEAEEFEVVAQCSAWATGGHGRRPEREEEGTKKRKAEGDDDGDDDGDGEEEEDGEEKDKDAERGCWQTRIPIDERRRAGDAAKRLLDGCRVLWLRRHAGATAAAAKEATEATADSSLLSVEARPYAPEGVTGENRLIVAVPRRRGGGT